MGGAIRVAISQPALQLGLRFNILHSGLFRYLLASLHIQHPQSIWRESHESKDAQHSHEDSLLRDVVDTKW